MLANLRRVVTAVDAPFTEGPPPKLIAAPSGLGVAELFWLDGPPASVADGGDRTTDGWPLEPPAGGLSSRLIQLPPSDEWMRIDGDDPQLPGMHTTDTLDLMLVLDGEITLGLADGERVVRAGEAVIQRGTPHRWRISGDVPCTYWVTMLRPGSATAIEPGVVVAGDGPVRRIVTGGGSAHDALAPIGIGGGGGQVTIVDLWQTGGPLATAAQGGDQPGPWQLQPVGGGVAFRWLELTTPPADGVGWHATATIDIDLVLSGRLALELDGGQRTELGAGDVVIQRGTNHRWVPLSPDGVRMAVVMIAVS